jgi:ribosomal protein L37AE/L43A
METTNMINGPKCAACKSPTVLYIFPHIHAGIWECLSDDCAMSDNHEHDTIEVQDENNDTMQQCGNCGVEVQI